MPSEEEVRALAQSVQQTLNGGNPQQILQALGGVSNFINSGTMPPPTTKGATTVATSSKTKAAIDADVTYFHFESDLAVAPPLKAALAKTLTSEYFTLRTSKDEDVVLKDGRMEIVTTEITGVKQNMKAGDQTYGYAAMKSSVEKIASECAAAGSNLNGTVVVQRGADDGVTGFWRLKVVDNNVTIEAALLGWPDGTTTPFPGA